MTNCNATALEFPRCQRRRVEAEFSGGDVTSDGGIVLLREMDRRLGLSKAIDRVLYDPRNPVMIQHSQRSLLQQRIYGLCLGYEDLNDHQTLRDDPAWQTAVERDECLASPSTLCRFENRFTNASSIALQQILVDQFIASFKRPPKRLMLDFDATDDRLHGHQEQRFFHGYYEHYCYLPLYVFCGQQLLVSYLRPSNIDGAKHSWAILSLLVKRLRQCWPKVKITMRADSGFCRWRMLRWCENHQVDYIIGISANSRLLAQVTCALSEAQQAYERRGEKVRQFSETHYQARSWDRARRVMARIEHTDKGSSSRFVVTNLTGDAQHLYEKLYCQRGAMENRIKEQQLGLFADRTSCHHWWPNQLRLLLASFAYVLLEALRRTTLQETELAQAQVWTLRLKLLKIGAVIIRNTRRVRILLSSAYPYQSLFTHVVEQLQPG